MMEAAKIVAKSAQYNLGGIRARSTCPPRRLSRSSSGSSCAICLQSRRTRQKSKGDKRLGVDFEEFDEPTLVEGTDEMPVYLVGSAWIDPESGVLWRAELTLRPKPDKPDPRISRALENRLRVDFTELPALKMMVPKEMWEVFWMPGGRGDGRARYSNFRSSRQRVRSFDRSSRRWFVTVVRQTLVHLGTFVKNPRGKPPWRTTRFYACAPVGRSCFTSRSTPPSRIAITRCACAAMSASWVTRMIVLPP